MGPPLLLGCDPSSSLLLDEDSVVFCCRGLLRKLKIPDLKSRGSEGCCSLCLVLGNSCLSVLLEGLFCDRRGFLSRWAELFETAASSAEVFALLTRSLL